MGQQIKKEKRNRDSEGSEGKRHRAKGEKKGTGKK
jgi:hypothetical protein